MAHVVAFAIFSTRRQEEITRIEWKDLDEAHSRVLVRDMKNPGDKIGNNVWVDLPDPALKIIQAMPRTGKVIFPYTTDAIGANFTRANLTLGINTKDMPDEERLKFHDLRHDGISRLFELGMNIPHAAAVSGHRSWTSLKRYTHVRQGGDKYADCPWLEVVMKNWIPNIEQPSSWHDYRHFARLERTLLARERGPGLGPPLRCQFGYFLCNERQLHDGRKPQMANRADMTAYRRHFGR